MTDRAAPARGGTMSGGQFALRIALWLGITLATTWAWWYALDVLVELSGGSPGLIYTFLAGISFGGTFSVLREGLPVLFNLLIAWALGLFGLPWIGKIGIVVVSLFLPELDFIVVLAGACMWGASYCL